jgi:hypothetical protein
MWTPAAELQFRQALVDSLQSKTTDPNTNLIMLGYDWITPNMVVVVNIFQVPERQTPLNFATGLPSAVNSQPSTVNTSGDQSTLPIAGRRLMESNFGNQESPLPISNQESPLAVNSHPLTVNTSGEQSTVNTSGEQSTVNTSGEQSTVNTSGQRSTGNTSGKQSTVNTSSEQSTANTSSEQSTVNTSGQRSTGNTSGEQSTVNTSGLRSTGNTSGEQSTVNTSSEQSTVDTFGQQSTLSGAGRQILQIPSAAGDETDQIASVIADFYIEVHAQMHINWWS